MSIWLTRKMKGTGSTDVDFMFRGLVAACLKTEFTYNKIVCNLEEFVFIWGAGDVLCNVVDETLIVSFKTNKQNKNEPKLSWIVLPGVCVCVCVCACGQV